MTGFYCERGKKQLEGCKGGGVLVCLLREQDLPATVLKIDRSRATTIISNGFDLFPEAALSMLI